VPQAVRGIPVVCPKCSRQFVVLQETVGPVPSPTTDAPDDGDAAASVAPTAEHASDTRRGSRPYWVFAAIAAAAVVMASCIGVLAVVYGVRREAQVAAGREAQVAIERDAQAALDKRDQARKRTDALLALGQSVKGAVNALDSESLESFSQAGQSLEAIDLLGVPPDIAQHVRNGALILTQTGRDFRTIQSEADALDRKRGDRAGSALLLGALIGAASRSDEEAQEALGVGILAGAAAADAQDEDEQQFTAKWTPVIEGNLARVDAWLKQFFTLFNRCIEEAKGDLGNR
jgi:hypothetical protein